MSAESKVSEFIGSEYAAAGIEVRGTAPGVVTVALPYHVEDIDDFIGVMQDKFEASVDMRATETGVELDVFPHSLEAFNSSHVAQTHRRCCSVWCSISFVCFVFAALCLLAFLAK